VGAILAATLYDRADMASVERYAVRHMKARRMMNPLPFHPDDHRRLQEAKERKERERREEAAHARRLEPRDCSELKRKEKEASIEMTDAKQRQSSREDAWKLSKRSERSMNREQSTVNYFERGRER
jgi:hypothetical protein